MKFTVAAAALFLASSQLALADGEAFLGTWTSDWRNQIDTKLVVHSVENGTADVTYSWGATQYNEAGSSRHGARVRGNKLSWSGGGTSFQFTERDGRLYAIRKAGGNIDRGTFRKVN
jgi:hypothetical protein